MITVRPAREDELDEVGRLTLAAYEQYRADIPDEYWGDYETELLDARTRAEQGVLLVAERDGRLVGTAALMPQEERMPILRMLAVSTDARRSGVARVLLDEVIERARAGGNRTLLWYTGSFMTSAVALYEALGFVQTGSRELGEDRYLIEYKLSL